LVDFRFVTGKIERSTIPARIFAPAVLAYALALALSASVPVTTVRADALAAARMTHMPLLSVRANTGALALFASVSVSAMVTNAAACAQLTAPSEFPVLANTLAAAVAAVILLPSVRARGSTTTFYAMNPQLLVLTYTAATAVLALVLVSPVWAQTSVAFFARHARQIVLACAAWTNSTGGSDINRRSDIHSRGDGSSYESSRRGGHVGDDGGAGRRCRIGCRGSGCGGWILRCRSRRGLLFRNTLGRGGRSFHGFRGKWFLLRFQCAGEGRGGEVC